MAAREQGSNDEAASARTKWQNYGAGSVLFLRQVARLQAADQADLAINGEAVLRDLDVSANQTRAVWMCLDVDGAMAS